MRNVERGIRDGNAADPFLVLHLLFFRGAWSRREWRVGGAEADRKAGHARLPVPGGGGFEREPGWEVEALFRRRMQYLDTLERIPNNFFLLIAAGQYTYSGTLKVSAAGGPLL